jgi:AAA15 family ATPase/GTPase
MLKKFSVEGFKNFEKKVTIDFSDVREYKFHPECINGGLLNTAIIYGKNAVGKSNFGLALFDIVGNLTMNNVAPGLYDYYFNTNNKNGWVEFEYEFVFGKDEIFYAYRKSGKIGLQAEYLKMNGSLYYSRLGAKLTHKSGILEAAPNLNWEHNMAMSTLKYFFYNTSLDANHPLSKMREFVNNMLWFNSLEENSFVGYKEKSRDYYTFILENEDYLIEFNALLGRSGINNTVAAKKDTDGETRLYFDTKTPMPFFKVASSGTKALYTFFYWYKTAPNVSLMYIDEFDAFYHYELAETIVSILEKISGFQKILTSHNTNLLSNRIMRPDCYFILTQDNLTSLANATRRELREGHNLEKLYMSGEFE